MSETNKVRIVAGVLVVLANLFDTNTIPTGRPGGGKKMSDALMGLAVIVAAGAPAVGGPAAAGRRKKS